VLGCTQPCWAVVWRLVGIASAIGMLYRPPFKLASCIQEPLVRGRIGVLVPLRLRDFTQTRDYPYAPSSTLWRLEETTVVRMRLRSLTEQALSPSYAGSGLLFALLFRRRSRTERARRPPSG
jgi:hypothetical protein